MEEKVGNRVIPIVSVGAVFVLMAVLTLTRGCSASDSGPTTETAADQGRRIYQLICVACHDTDPNVDRGTDGTYGPAVADSSLELLQMRVTSVEYPEGYTPKRTTSLMTPFPLSESQISALYAYLSAVADDPPK